MADVSQLIDKILKWEGEAFTNDPNDLGGATKYGVTFNTFAPWFKGKYGKEATIDDLKNLDKAGYTEILRDLYWDKCDADSIRNQQVANSVVDWFYNAGYHATKDIQEVLGIHPADGILGTASIATINVIANQNPEMVVNTIADRREAFYRNIVAANPSQGRFLQGWLNRTNDYRYQPGA